MSETLRQTRSRTPKVAHSAIMEGVTAGARDPAKISKVENLFRETKDGLLDLYVTANERQLPLSSLEAVGYAVGSILTNPALKCAQGSQETLLTPTNAQLVREVLSVAVNPEHRLEINLAIGGSEAPPSLRLPIYVDAAIQVAEGFFPTTLKLPRVRIFNAFEISTSINGLDAELAAKRAEQASQLATGYVQTFYPLLRKCVVVENLTASELDADIFEHDAARLLLLLQSDRQLMNAQETEAFEALTRLRRAAAKNYTGGDSNIEAIICGYAATHGQSYRNYGSSSVDGVIKVGGRGEASFDVLQQYLSSVHAKIGRIAVSNLKPDGSTQLVNLRMRAGDVPPYYPQRDSQGKLELTVESTPDDIPLSYEVLKAQYKRRGLLTGSDFDHLPPTIREQLPYFLKNYLTTCQDV